MYLAHSAKVLVRERYIFCLSYASVFRYKKNIIFLGNG